MAEIASAGAPCGTLLFWRCLNNRRGEIYRSNHSKLFSYRLNDLDYVLCKFGSICIVLRWCKKWPNLRSFSRIIHQIMISFHEINKLQSVWFSAAVERVCQSTSTASVESRSAVLAVVPWGGGKTCPNLLVLFDQQFSGSEEKEEEDPVSWASIRQHTGHSIRTGTTLVASPAVRYSNGHQQKKSSGPIRMIIEFHPAPFSPMFTLTYVHVHVYI